MDAVRRARAAARSGARLGAAALLIGGCGGGSSDQEPSATSQAKSPPAAPILTKTDVPADCRASVPVGNPADAVPAGLLSPPGRIAIGTVEGPVVSGFVDQTPGTFLAAWRARSGVEIDGENEGIEGEVYVKSGEDTVAWRLRKVCKTGSTFTATIGGAE